MYVSRPSATTVHRTTMTVLLACALAVFAPAVAPAFSLYDFEANFGTSFGPGFDDLALTSGQGATDSTGEQVLTTDSTSGSNSVTTFHTEITAPGEEAANSIGLLLCSIPPGDFDQGYPGWVQSYVTYQQNQRSILSRSSSRLMNEVREGPRRRVTIGYGFWMGKFEVTQREYTEIMGRNPSRFTRGDRENRPVESVTLEDAIEFCIRLTEHERTAGTLPAGWVYRLPTESEWEYAARAGEGSNLYGEITEIAWTRSSHPRSGDGTRVVGTRQPNAWGLHDMLGNVWEWTLDLFDGLYHQDAPTDGSAWTRRTSTASYNVIRGGGWNTIGRDLRLSTRSSTKRHRRGFAYVGFRVVLAPNDGLGGRR